MCGEEGECLYVGGIITQAAEVDVSRSKVPLRRPTGEEQLPLTFLK